MNILKNSYQEWYGAVRYGAVLRSELLRWPLRKLNYVLVLKYRKTITPLRNGGSVILPIAIFSLRIIFGIYRNSFDMVFEMSCRNRIADY